MRSLVKNLAMVGLALLVVMGAAGICGATGVAVAVGAPVCGVGGCGVGVQSVFATPLTSTRLVRSVGGTRTVFVPANTFGTNVVVGSPFVNTFGVNTFGVGGFNTFGVNRAVLVNRGGVNRNVAVNVNRGVSRNVAVNVNRGRSVQKNVAVNRVAPRVQVQRSVTRVR